MFATKSRPYPRQLISLWVGTACSILFIGSKALFAQSAPAVLGPDVPAIEWFGYSVAASGDVALVGATLDDDKGTSSGSAYIFRFNGSTWVREQKLFASDELAYDGFGTSLAIDGDTAIVGVPYRDDRGADSGAVYVFHWSGSNWVQEQKLLASDGASSDLFGSSVSLAGDVIVVGAYQETNEKGFKAGSAYVFRWNGSSWVQTQKLLASDGAGADFFGISVAASGEVIVVGAHGDDDKGSSSGSAYVFRWNGSSWAQQQKLVASDGTAADVFGSAVAVYGDVAVVGAYQDDSRGLGFGSAYVFRFNGSTWIQETELYASDGATNDSFGSSVAISGNMVLVGAYQDDDKGSSSGSAYIFRFNGSTWAQESKLLDANGRSNDRFGYSVAASGDRAVVGAYWADASGGDAGATFVFGQSSGCVANAGCNDNNDCTNDICSSGVCSNQPKPNGSACGSSTTSDCDNPDTCSNGTCVPNYDPSNTLCSDDGNLCTNDTCNGAGSCTHPNKSNGTSCNDGNACTTGDTCASGVCAGTPLNCDDGKVCTTDSCVNGVCQYAFNTAACNDGNLCTTNDRCTSGVCAGSPMTCNDNNPCTNDSCSAGACQYINNTNFCDDGNSCTTGDRCAGGVCSGTPMTCNDNNPCTTDSCSASVCQYVNNTNTCDDANSCSSGDRCLNGACVGTPMVCNDNNPCTTDSCSNGACQFVNNANACNDGNACTTSDRCSNGLCGGTPMVCNDNNPCTTDSCSSGTCQYVNNANSCTDGNACTTGDHCSNGTCSGTPMDCNDNNPCTNDSCANGLCQYSYNANTCNDGNGCTTGDRCTNGVCAGTPMVCNDNNTCTNDFCSAGVCQFVNNTNSCTDGNACTTLDRCVSGVCTGTPMNCGDNNPCTNDSCSNGVCQHAYNTNTCDDGDTCTTGDQCVNGTCTGSLLASCCGDGVCDLGEDGCTCIADCGAPPLTELDCNDGYDDDCDGRIDCADADCNSAPNCACLVRSQKCSKGADCCSGVCGRNHRCR